LVEAKFRAGQPLTITDPNIDALYDDLADAVIWFYTHFNTAITVILFVQKSTSGHGELLACAF